MELFDLKTQYHDYKEAIDAGIHQVLNSGKYILGEAVYELEERLAGYVGVKHVISASSGTDTLLMALMALGVGPGDEVITTPFSFVSSATMIPLLSATPVFIDIEEDTYNMNPDLLEKAITERTKAILPVNIFGQMANYNKIHAIAEKYGLPVLEDGAQSFGASQHGKRSCGISTVGSTSFFPTKPFGCYGDGGALFTNDDNLAAELRKIRVHGGLERDHYERIGINGRLDTLQAAILLAKLPHLDKELQRRQELGTRYNQLLQGLVITPTVRLGNTHIYAIYSIQVPDRKEVALALKQAGVPTAVYYPKGIYEQPAFAHLGYTKYDFPICKKITENILALPMHPWLSFDDQDRVVLAVEKALMVGAKC